MRALLPSAAHFNTGGGTPVKGGLGSLRRLTRYLTPYRRKILAAGIAILFTSSAVLGMGMGLRYLVDEGLGKGDRHLLDNAFLLLLGVTLLLAAATYWRFYLVSWIGERVVADIRNDVYRHVIHLDVGFFETTRVGEILSRLTTDTTLLQTVIGSSVSIALRNSLMLIGGVALLLLTSTKLAGYVAILLPLVLIPILVLGRRVRALSRASQTRVADISSHAQESFSGIRTVQALSLEEAETQRFSGLVREALVTALSRIRTRAWLTAIVICLVFGAIVTVLWIGGRDVLTGAITPGDLSAFIFYSVIVAGAVGALSEVIGDLQRAAGATERLMELLSHIPALPVTPNPIPIPSPLRGSISLEGVTFHYPSRPARAALEGVTLSIAPGETVALVGPSGAGKTTLFQLLLRFYDPQRGTVRIDGMALKDFDPIAWRRCIGLVPQDPLIFTGSVWENVRCARPEAPAREIIEAVEKAAALEFIEKLPEGMDSFLGEKGVRLSGGQRQRIAIARTILRNPAILLLDEATNALDAHNEQLVQQALSVVMKGRTTLVIAHRLSTVQKANRIIVLNEGRIEATGTHAELLARSPLYARLAELQFGKGEIGN